MADERQTAKEAAISAFEHSADAVLTLLEQEGAAHAAATIELAKATTKAVHAAREGDWDAFGANTLAASTALLNSALGGAPGSAIAFNQASVALARAFGSDASGITFDEAMTAGLREITDDIANYAFESAYPDEVRDVREQGGETKASPDFRPMERLDRATLDQVRGASSQEMTFEPELITRSDKSDPGNSARQGETATPDKLVSLDTGPQISDTPIGDTPNMGSTSAQFARTHWKSGPSTARTGD